MANSEACELYIEQQIEEGLEEGKTPYSIGKELSTWIAKLFEVRIKPTTIEKRAERKRTKLPTNVGKESQHIETIEDTTPDIIKERKPQGGGKRKNAGRKKSWNNHYNRYNTTLIDLRIAIDELKALPEWREHKDSIMSDINNLIINL